MAKLSDKLDKMPEFLSSQDLVNLGIYGSLNSAYLARVRLNSPPYIKLKHKILYVKSELIAFLESRMKSGVSTRHHPNEVEQGGEGKE